MFTLMFCLDDKRYSATALAWFGNFSTLQIYSFDCVYCDHGENFGIKTNTAAPKGLKA